MSTCDPMQFKFSSHLASKTHFQHPISGYLLKVESSLMKESYSKRDPRKQEMDVNIINSESHSQPWPLHASILVWNDVFQWLTRLSMPCVEVCHEVDITDKLSNDPVPLRSIFSGKDFSSPKTTCLLPLVVWLLSPGWNFRLHCFLRKEKWRGRAILSAPSFTIWSLSQSS